MMDILTDIIAYIVINYPRKNDLSKAKLTKIIYLLDWKSALVTNQQITELEWTYDYFGPYNSNIKSIIESRTDLFWVHECSFDFSQTMKIVHMKNEEYSPSLSENVTQVLDNMISIACEMTWNQLNQLVDSTFPIMTSERFSKLDLVAKASEYKKNRDK